MKHEDDCMGSIRGIAFAVLFSAPLWVVISLAAWGVWKICHR